MTIGGYIGAVARIAGEVQEIAVQAIDLNDALLVMHTEDRWDQSQTPSFETYRLKALWSGSDPSESYRKRWGIHKSVVYPYNHIDISGDTRSGLRVEGGRMFSTVPYWGNILRRFGEVGMNPVDFSGLPSSDPVKEEVAAVFIETLRQRIR